VGFSGAQHEVDQPSHLVVADRPVQRRVLAGVRQPLRELLPGRGLRDGADPDQPGRKKLFIHHENCVHCKTCDIADPTR
jgi:electron-transferring-flavoprotein dehydrogenase